MISLIGKTGEPGVIAETVELFPRNNIFMVNRGNISDISFYVNDFISCGDKSVEDVIALVREVFTGSNSPGNIILYILLNINADVKSTSMLMQFEKEIGKTLIVTFSDPTTI